MPRRVPLDPQLAGTAFLVRAGVAAGHTYDRLDGADLGRPFHGVRSRGVLSPHEAYVPLLRAGDRFSHTTAAMLWGAPVPARHAAALHVTAGPGLERPRSRGVVGHVSANTESTNRGGLPVSAPRALFLELASVLSYIELVAVADHLVLDPRVLEPGSPRPLATLADLRADSHTAKSRGARTARDAARAAREGVESPMETALRLLLIEAGTPEPLCGYELSGIGWFDLAWPEYRTIAEYDGDQHRTSTRQYERDIRRFDQATDRGWRVVRVRQRGILVDAGTTAHRVRAALIHGGWLPNGRESA